MIIAKSGEYELRLPTYLSDHEYMTHDLEICKRESEHNTNYTIAKFNEDGEIVSCGGRLLKELNDMDSIDSVRELADIAEAIIATENVQSGYGTMKSITCTSYYPNGEEKETRIYKKPTDQDLEVWQSVKYDDDGEFQYFYSEASAKNYLIDGRDEYIIHEGDGYFTIEIGDEEIGEYSKLEIKL